MNKVLPILFAFAAAPVFAASEQAPYAGRDARSIASLSQEDVDALLAGRGWGLALPAELNGYPGPIHVLDAADELELTADQRARITAIYEDMQARAQALGREYVDTEAHLSRMFSMGHAAPGMLDDLLAQSAALLANLRSVHLLAHLDVTPLLTDRQKARYAALRGYGSADHEEHGQHGGH